MKYETIHWHCPKCLVPNTTSNKPPLTCTACGHVVPPTKTVFEFEGERIYFDNEDTQP